MEEGAKILRALGCFQSIQTHPVSAMWLDSNLQCQLFLVYNSNVMWILVKKLSYRKPGLSPWRYVCYTTMIKDPLSCSCTSIGLTTIRSFPKYTHTNVAESRAKHDAMAFYVKSPSTIFILKYDKFIA